MTRPSTPLSNPLAKLLMTLLLLVGSVAVAGAFDWLSYLTGQRSLAKIEADISRRFTDIGHMPPKGLAERLANPQNIVLLDVREPTEFAVSHLPGAVRVTPGADVAEILKTLEGRIAGKTVVFYCSVGERSSRLAHRVRAELMKRGAVAVDNLKGGIFAWHNQQRPLVSGQGQPTPYVHPFDSSWGKLVDRQSLTRMKP
ncbi:MAG: rhodanese-like domain-containing protein [Hyphomicrobiaceae bacterium]|nr:rhodanese-like domain-containing protein [Hyphomicrobiaceae bacterium]